MTVIIPAKVIPRRISIAQRESRAGLVLVAPTTVLLTVFYLYPLAQSVFYSFTDWNPSSGAVASVIGFENFANTFTDPSFLRAAGNTAIYVAVVVPVSMILGLLLAVMLDKPFRGRSVYRVMIFTPYIAPVVGSALIFSYLLSPLGGLVNGVIRGLGLPPIGFLNSEPWALITVLVFSIWQLVGYTMIIYSAALSAIPPSYYEAATLDGAGPVRRFTSIILPLVGPTSGFLAVTGTISALQVFTQVYILTEGGPLGSTQTVLFWIYEQGFVFFNGGAASAGAVVLLFVGIGISVVQIVAQSRRGSVELA